MTEFSFEHMAGKVVLKIKTQHETVLKEFDVRDGYHLWEQFLVALVAAAKFSDNNKADLNRDK